jgi:tetratricopeptide (TPR) repeat protein
MRIKIFILIFLLSGQIFAQDVNLIIKKARIELQNANESNALKLYQQAIKLDPSNVEVILGIGKIQTRLGHRLKTVDDKKAMYNACIVLSEKAIKLNPKNAEAYYSKALAIGRLVQISDVKEKIRLSRILYIQAEKAIDLNPKHAGAWHILGKYHWEMSQLNLIEKGAIKAMGGLPAASKESAIRFFENCYKNEPTNLLNLYDLAIGYESIEKKKEAIVLLETLLTTKNSFQDDEINKVNARKLLLKWKK